MNTIARRRLRPWGVSVGLRKREVGPGLYSFRHHRRLLRAILIPGDRASQDKSRREDNTASPCILRDFDDGCAV